MIKKNSAGMMKRSALRAPAVAMLALCLVGAGWGGGDSHGGGGGGSRGGGGGGHVQAGGGGHSAAPARSFSRPSYTVYRRQHVSIPKTTMPARGEVFRDQNRAVFPQRGTGGPRITQRAAATPPSYHLAVVQNSALVRNIRQQQRNEVIPNHYYWHNDNGIRYSHYYDGKHHWYGFYHGPTFYWTRYHGGRWWWYDVAHTRWDFWGNGYWWWVNPAGAAYVYLDNDYYPYQDEDSGVTVEDAEDQPAPAAVPAPSASGGHDSPDGRRTVQIFGDDAQAFLYDKTTTPPTFMKYLGSGVSQVRYSGGTAGKALQILVQYKDDTFAVFDGDGNSLSSVVESAESANPAPPSTPDSIPPPPTTAPGE